MVVPRPAPSDAPTLTFLGAAGTVTGSKHLLRAHGRSYLVDCGLFQGDDELEQRDWRPLPVAPADIDAVVLTHAHIDHSGFLPRLVAQGFRGHAYCTAATRALLEILLPDAGHLQEEQAAYANRKGFSRHRPAQPLFTRAQAVAALDRLVPLPYDAPYDVDDVLRVTFRPSGHLLGAAIVVAEVRVAPPHAHETPRTRVVFSGDLGRYGQEVMRAPVAVAHADHLVVEATYGDSVHPRRAPEDALEEAVLSVVRSGGVLLVPSFTVGRAQTLLYFLRKLVEQRRIPELPIIVDSPMATEATGVYCAHGDEPNLNVRLTMDVEDCPLHCRTTHFVRSAEESRALNALRGPAVIVSANGMCTGGRIVHHLRNRLPVGANAVLFVGYQAEGTRGRRLLDGARTLRIHGHEVDVRARILRMDMLSGHADREELLRWLGNFEAPPASIHLVHAEPGAARALQEALRSRLGWEAHVPRLEETVTLDRASEGAPRRARPLPHDHVVM